MKFSIKELGKIKSADFEIKDLTIFVGKNSTNKSYVAHTVYMLNKAIYELESIFMGYINNELFEVYLEKNRKFLQDIELLKRKETFSETTVNINEDGTKTPFAVNVEFEIKNNQKLIDDIIKSIIKYLNDFILKEVNNNFNSNSDIIKNINLHTKCKIDLNKINKFEIGTIQVNTDTNIEFLKNIFDKILNIYGRSLISNKEYYFPASRTGFVLAFDEIISGLLRDKFSNKSSSTKLTKPTIDFLLMFSDIKSSRFEIIQRAVLMIDDSLEEYRKKLNDILKFIEKRMIKGKIVREDTLLNNKEFYFKPNNTKELELFLTSSSTVEMLPLIVFLQNIDNLKDILLIIEESEAHLHPQAQIEMARLLVMLVNAGAKVLITTHSDYIISEISNCIKLSNINKNELTKYLKKYELSKDIVISKDRVSTYLFKENKNKVEAKELNIDNYGIDNENFDEILDELLDRTQEINENIEG